VLTCDCVPGELPQVREQGDNGPSWHWYTSQAARAGQGVTIGSQPPGHNWGGTWDRVSPFTEKHAAPPVTLAGPQPSSHPVAQAPAGVRSQTNVVQNGAVHGRDCGAQAEVCWLGWSQLVEAIATFDAA